MFLTVLAIYTVLRARGGGGESVDVLCGTLSLWRDYSHMFEILLKSFPSVIVLTNIYFHNILTLGKTEKYSVEYWR